MRPPSKQRSGEFHRALSRRDFGRVAALVTAGAAVPIYNESAMAQLSAGRGPIPPDAIRLNANENPLGPCPEALDAVHRIAGSGGRYLHEDTLALQDLIAGKEGLRPGYVQPFAGSSPPLHQAVLAFCSTSMPLVTADPGYEAPEIASRAIGAGVFRVPLTATHAHDVRKMARASETAGLIYVCNPNNPSGTLTPRADIEWLLKNKPKDSVVVLDEAYIHYTGAPGGTDLVANDKDLVVLRTFSKLYGLAGLRVGAAFARPDLLEKIRTFGRGALPITGVAAATASLQAKDLIAQRRETMVRLRADIFEFLDSHNFSYVPSVSNKFMLDVKRPGEQIIDAMQKENIYIGRVWPAWPTHVRVSIGTAAEMARFQNALLKVMA